MRMTIPLEPPARPPGPRGRTLPGLLLERGRLFVALTLGVVAVAGPRATFLPGWVDVQIAPFEHAAVVVELLRHAPGRPTSRVHVLVLGVPGDGALGPIF